MRFIKKWLLGQEPEKQVPPKVVRAIGERRARPRPTGANPTPEPPIKPKPVELETKVEGRIESAGPGKNVLIQNEYQREGTRELEELKLVDEAEENDNADGIDPYNTGRFDRSKFWDKRFRK